MSFDSSLRGLINVSTSRSAGIDGDSPRAPAAPCTADCSLKANCDPRQRPYAFAVNLKKRDGRFNKRETEIHFLTHSDGRIHGG